MQIAKRILRVLPEKENPLSIGFVGSLQAQRQSTSINWEKGKGDY
jgi:hypothetical protein